MARPRLSLLGGFQFSSDSADAQALGRKSRALIAYLALQGGQARSREQLAALLWGSHGDTHARVNLRQSLMEIRKVFRLAGAPVLKTLSEDVVLDLSGVEFDVARFEALTGRFPGKSRTRRQPLSRRLARWFRRKGRGVRGLVAGRARTPAQHLDRLARQACAPLRRNGRFALHPGCNAVVGSGAVTRRHSTGFDARPMRSRAG